MNFNLSDFQKQVSELAEKRNSGDLKVEDAITCGDLEFLDVNDAAYLLEDRGKVPDAENVYRFPVKVFRDRLCELSEAA